MSVSPLLHRNSKRKFEVFLVGFRPKGKRHISPGQRWVMETPKWESPERAEQSFELVVPPFQGFYVVGPFEPRAALVAAPLRFALSFFVWPFEGEIGLIDKYLTSLQNRLSTNIIAHLVLVISPGVAGFLSHFLACGFRAQGSIILSCLGFKAS